MGTYRPYDLYVTDEAYQRITDQARIMGLIRGEHNAKGLARYVEYVLLCHMEDVRPQDVRDQDADLLAANYGPEWRLYTPPKRRRIMLQHVTLVEATVRAVQLGMAFPPERRVLSAPTFMDGPQCLSAILEAIGTEWLKVTMTDD